MEQLSKPHRFHLRKSKSPTYFNLARYLKDQGWSSTLFNRFANFSEKNFQFSTPASQSLEFKNLLAQLVATFCPHVMPQTFCINDKNWPSVLSKLTDKYYMKDEVLSDQVDDLVWILKPALLNNGKDIQIFQKLSQLEHHYLGRNRLGGEHVLQQYILHPHLLKGHKYSIRMFVVLTNYADSYIYPQGYFNVALTPYQPNDFTTLSSHLTNEHLTEESSNVVQIPTPRFDLFPQFYQEIKGIIAETLRGLKQLCPNAFVCHKQRTLAIFGFDFLVESDMRVWLLEANHGPCFPTSDDHPLQKFLYYDFWQAFISSFVLPIAVNQPLNQIQYSPFESI